MIKVYDSDVHDELAAALNRVMHDEWDAASRRLDSVSSGDLKSAYFEAFIGNASIAERIGEHSFWAAQVRGAAKALNVWRQVQNIKIPPTYYIHKHEVRQERGGSEEGGWWYDCGEPCTDWVPPAFDDEEDAYEECRKFNMLEGIRQDREERYGYTSVLSYQSTHYSYSVHETSVMESYPEERPHYE